MLTWTKINNGYETTTPNGVYTITRTPGRRYALTHNGRDIGHKPGKVGDAKDAAEKAEPYFAAANKENPDENHVPAAVAGVSAGTAVEVPAPVAYPCCDDAGCVNCGGSGVVYPPGTDDYGVSEIVVIDNVRGTDPVPFGWASLDLPNPPVPPADPSVPGPAETWDVPAEPDPGDPYSPDKVLDPEPRTPDDLPPLPEHPAVNDPPNPDLPPLPNHPAADDDDAEDTDEEYGDPGARSPIAGGTDPYPWLFTPPPLPRDGRNRVVHSWLPNSMHAA